MEEFIALLMFMGLAFGMGFAALLATGFKALYDWYQARQRNRMPARIRSLNG